MSTFPTNSAWHPSHPAQQQRTIREVMGGPPPEPSAPEPREVVLSHDTLERWYHTLDDLGSHVARTVQHYGRAELDESIAELRDEIYAYLR